MGSRVNPHKRASTWYDAMGRGERVETTGKQRRKRAKQMKRGAK